MVSPPRLWGVAVTLLCLLVGTAAAQTKIPYDVVTASSVLTPTQQQQIEAYLTDKTALLIDGSPNEIALARQQMIEPLYWAGGTEIFHLAYSSIAGRLLAKGMDSDRLQVRLNAMIIVSSLNDPGVVILIEKGLADESSAIRYWAAKSVNRNITGRLSPQEQQFLLDALAKAMLTETSDRVLERLLVGLVGLDIPEAATQLLEGLNARIKLYAANPRMPLSAALEGLRTLFVKTVQAKADGQDISVEIIRQLALVSYRYFDLSAAVLDMDRPTDENRANYEEMLKLNNAILSWTARQMPPEGLSVPLSINNELSNQNWQMIRLRAEEWKRVLTGAPFNFGLVELMVTVPENRSG